LWCKPAHKTIGKHTVAIHSDDCEKPFSSKFSLTFLYVVFLKKPFKFDFYQTITIHMINRPSKLQAHVPDGLLEEKWDHYKSNARLISRNNKKKYTVIVVGTGLGGASAASTLAEAGYQVKNFCFHESPRQAHSVAAQGGVNAMKNYCYDGDSVHRMFVDTLKGGDFRSREASVYRMAECSSMLIDQAVAQGVPFAREYSGYLANRSFGGVQVQRTFYARGQTGQQLLLGAYGSLMRQVNLGNVCLHTRHEMLELVVENGRACGIITRDLVSGKIEKHAAHAVVLATGGYGKIFYLATLAMGCNGSAVWRAHKKGAFMANPSWVQVHPTSLPQHGSYQSKLTLMSESLRNDGRIWVPTRQKDTRHPSNIPEEERDYYLERLYPAYGNLAPRDISSRAAKRRMDEGFGVGPLGNAVYLDFRDAIKQLGKKTIEERYGNLFDMYRQITGIDAYSEPMKIAPAAHFTMGGLWVDYDLMTTIPGLFAVGECNFADHGANRLGANSLLQVCVDGYYILPYTLTNFLAQQKPVPLCTDSPGFEAAEQAVAQQLRHFLSIKGNKNADYYHRALGKILWDACGLVRNRPSLESAIAQIEELREDFWKDLRVPGDTQGLNAELEKAGRVADYLELGALMCHDALNREESCGAHFREEYQTPEGEALRDDENFCHVSAWEFNGQAQAPTQHQEYLYFEKVKLTARSYK
jgi:succinate dehydrogenase / fumarate reductase flavoprotein subunit